MRDPESVIRNPANTFSFTTFRWQEQKVQEQIRTLDNALRSDDESPLSIPEHDTTAEPVFQPQFLYNPQLSSRIREIMQKKVRRMIVLGMERLFLKAAEYALPSAFKIGPESVKDKLKNAFSGFVESVLTNFAFKGALDDMLDRNIKKWTHFSTFIRSIRSHPTFRQLLSAVPKFTRKEIVEKPDKV